MSDALHKDRHPHKWLSVHSMQQVDKFHAGTWRSHKDVVTMESVAESIAQTEPLSALLENVTSLLIEGHAEEGL